MVLSIERDLSVIIISIVLVVLSVFMAARPLDRLRREVEARSTDDLSPVSASEVPGEVLPNYLRKPTHGPFDTLGGPSAAVPG